MSRVSSGKVPIAQGGISDMLKTLKLTALAVTLALVSMSCEAEPVSDEPAATEAEPVAAAT